VDKPSLGGDTCRPFRSADNLLSGRERVKVIRCSWQKSKSSLLMNSPLVSGLMTATGNGKTAREDQGMAQHCPGMILVSAGQLNDLVQDGPCHRSDATSPAASSRPCAQPSSIPSTRRSPHPPIPGNRGDSRRIINEATYPPSRRLFMSRRGIVTPSKMAGPLARPRSARESRITLNRRLQSRGSLYIV
jgi:hypothetical protein